MTDHLSAELLEGYRQRRLQPEQLLAVDDHVTTCPACREMIREMTPSREALASLRASLQPALTDDPLADDLMQAYVEDRSDT